MIFTDGSGFAGHIGASTASYYPGITSQRRYLGTDSQSTVYAAELSGIEMALAKTRKEQAREVIIFSDSQAAIQAVRNPQRPSGQYVLTHIYNHVRAIRSQSQLTKVTIRWIPVYVGVDGNEFADGEAKSAALLGAGMGVATGPDNRDNPSRRSCGGTPANQRAMGEAVGKTLRLYEAGRSHNMKFRSRCVQRELDFDTSCSKSRQQKQTDAVVTKTHKHQGMFRCSARDISSRAQNCGSNWTELGSDSKRQTVTR